MIIPYGSKIDNFELAHEGNIERIFTKEKVYNSITTDVCQKIFDFVIEDTQFSEIYDLNVLNIGSISLTNSDDYNIKAKIVRNSDTLDCSFNVINYRGNLETYKTVILFESVDGFRTFKINSTSLGDVYVKLAISNTSVTNTPTYSNGNHSTGTLFINLAPSIGNVNVYSDKECINKVGGLNTTTNNGLSYTILQEPLFNVKVSLYCRARNTYNTFKVKINEVYPKNSIYNILSENNIEETHSVSEFNSKKANAIKYFDCTFI